MNKRLSGALAVLVLLTAGVVAGCASGGKAVRAVQPKGRLLFSIRRTFSALAGPVKGDSGFFFYIEDFNGFPGYLITGYEMRGGKVVDSFGGGNAASEELLAQIEAVHFEAFDFDAELKRVEDAHRNPYIFVDGYGVEIRFVHRDIDFRADVWNPTPHIDYAARFSPAIAKLKALLDVIALHYGRVKMF